MSTVQMMMRPELKESLLEVLRPPRALPEVDRITVAAYNAYNLFDKESDRETPPPQMRALGQMILEMRPHVIAFAEVQNENVIRTLFRTCVNGELGPSEKYDGFVCLAGNDRRGINVALVTRLSVRGAMTFHDREFDSSEGRTPVKFSRDLLGVEIQMTPKPEHRYIHFAAHLKSKIGGAAAEEKRGMEAWEIAGILSEGAFGRSPFVNQDILLTGDMNDDPDSRVIGILTSSGLDDTFANVNPNHTYPTKINEGKPNYRRYDDARLDYLLASPSLSSRLSNLKIHHGGAADRASDHYPISAVLRVG